MVKLKNSDIEVEKYRLDPKQPGRRAMFWIHNTSDTEWLTMKIIMNDNFIDSESYKIKQECRAFFQVGSSGNEDCLAIKFWKDDAAAIQRFMFHFFEKLQKAYEDGRIEG